MGECDTHGAGRQQNCWRQCEEEVFGMMMSSIGKVMEFYNMCLKVIFSYEENQMGKQTKRHDG